MRYWRASGPPSPGPDHLAGRGKAALRVRVPVAVAARRTAVVVVGVLVMPVSALLVVTAVQVLRREGKGGHARAARHVLLAQLPVHRLGGTPGDRHLLGHLCPHLGFEPVDFESFTPLVSLGFFLNIVLFFFPIFCVVNLCW